MARARDSLLHHPEALAGVRFGIKLPAGCPAPCRSKQAAAILGIGVTTLNDGYLDQPLVRRVIQWRWGDSRGRCRIDDTASLYQYLALLHYAAQPHLFDPGPPPAAAPPSPETKSPPGCISRTGCI